MMKCLLYLTILVLVEKTITGLPDQLQNPFAANTKNDKLIVQISNGKIRGRSDTTVGLNKPYVAFEGIPFAQPPVGDLRFEPPVPPKSWIGILNTTEYKGDCIQIDSTTLDTTGSEDCLYINVYKPDIKQRNLAVMVWIYGGAFSMGTSSPNSYGSDYLLDNDVIVVTFNYRLGIFGFLSTGDLIVPGNSGLKDQLLALKWVKKNIAKFGGNSNKITIFGESAGAASVAYQLTSTKSIGLYNKAILDSGNSLCLWALSRKMPEAVNLVAQTLNLTTNNSLELVTAFKSINSATLNLVSIGVSNVLQGPYTEGLIFAPVTEPLHPGAIITKKSHQLLTEGRFQRVPVLHGINSMESLLFSAFVEAYYQNSSIERVDIVPIDLNLVDEGEIDLVYNKIKNFYFGSEEIYNQTYETYQFASDHEFNRPAVEFNRLLSKYTKTYFYEFSYSGNLSNLYGEFPIPGVPHTAELFYIWNPKLGITPSDTDILVRNRMTKLWTNFAKFSNPTPKRDDLFDEVLWYPSDLIEDNLVYLNINSDLELSLNPKNHYIKFWNKLYREYGNPPFDTY